MRAKLKIEITTDGEPSKSVETGAVFDDPRLLIAIADLLWARAGELTRPPSVGETSNRLE